MHHLADAAHRLRVAADHRDGADVVQQILGGDRRRPDTALGEREILWNAGVQVVTHHQHVEMLVEGVDGMRPRRVGGTRQHVRVRDHGDDVGRVPASRTLGVIRVDRAALDRGEGVLDEAGLVEGVRVQIHLHTRRVRDGQARVDRRGCGSPVLVQLESRCAGPQLLPHRVGADRVSLAKQRDVERPRVQRLQHPGQVPGPWRHSGGLAALGRTGAARDDRGDSAADGLLHDLRADQVDVAVDGARRDDAAIACDDLRRRPDHQIGVHAAHDVGVARLADRRDAAIANADVGLDDSPVVDDHHAGDDGVGRAVGAGRPPLPHRLAQAPCRRRTPPRHRPVRVRRCGPR